MKTPILFTEEFWKNSQLSIARFYGGITFNDVSYSIVNKHGVTLRELSDPKSKLYVGDGKLAIEPGEPADLVQNKYIPKYRKMGREKFMEAVENGKIS